MTHIQFSPVDTETAGDNSTYYDSNTAQKLKAKDIGDLREQGASGHDIIRQLIQNSDTWQSKSQFAREKWLARKQKRSVFASYISFDVIYELMRCYAVDM